MAIFAELKRSMEENKVVIAVGTGVGLVLGTAILLQPRKVTDLEYSPSGDLIVKYSRGQDKVIGHSRV